MNEKEQFSCIYDSSQEKKEGGGVPSKSCRNDSHLFMWINSHSGLTWPCFLVLSSLFWKQVFGPHQLERNLCTVHFSCFVLPSFSLDLPSRFSCDFRQYLLEAGWAAEGKVIGVTQPRRVAAISVRTPLISSYCTARSLFANVIPFTAVQLTPKGTHIP